MGIEGLNELVNPNMGVEVRNLVEDSGIEGLEVPQNLKASKQRIQGLLNFRNEHQDFAPNCNEMMDVMIDFNNSLSREKKQENPDNKSCENLRNAFDVLYNNVINEALLDSGYANKDSNLYKMFDTVYEGLQSPKRINLESKEYLKVLAGFNYFQREQLSSGNLVAPNPSESMVLEDSDEYDLSDSLRKITDEVKLDINSPERMKERESKEVL